MFGRPSRGRVVDAGANTRDAPMRVHRETIVVADPDCGGIKRVRALDHQIGVGLQGEAGVVVRYDQGDLPSGMALSRIVAGVPDPTAALAQISRPADAQTLRTLSADYHTVPSINPDLDPTAAAWWARLAR